MEIPSTQNIIIHSFDPIKTIMKLYINPNISVILLLIMLMIVGSVAGDVTKIPDCENCLKTEEVK